MITLQEVKAKLDALGTLGTIVMGFLPATPDVIGIIEEYGGLTSERQFGQVGIGYENPSIQVSFRGAAFDYLGPRTKAEIAYNYLMSLQPGVLGAGVTTEYCYFDAQQPPHPVAAVDTSNRARIGINFYIKKRISV